MRHPDYHPPACHAQHRILMEEDSFLMVEKPEGLLSVPGRHVKDSLISRIQADYPNATIVHRLDLDTSGIMVIPTRKSALSEIARQFRERLVRKTYQAVVHGIVEDSTGEIDLPIGADWEQRPRHKIDFENGKAALTRFEVLERDTSGNRTRLELKPVTGRSHQLRLHLKEIGHPILGCDLYAHDEAYEASERLLLHATELTIIHPGTGEPVTAGSPVPF